MSNIEGINPYQAIGGATVCRELATAFYARAGRDAVLRPFFPGKTHKCAIEEFSAFLAQFLGGPPENAQRRWWLSLRQSHLRFRIGQRERDAWMKNMIQAMDEVAIAEPARSALQGFFERSSAYLVNDGQAAGVTDERRERSAGDNIHPAISRRWVAQRMIDDAVAAVHRGDAAGAIALAAEETLETYFRGSRTAVAALLGLMIASGNRTMLDYVHEKLRADPELCRQRYSGRTLLHAAAAAGSLTTVELLLQLGAGASSTDDGGHTPLYCLANECNAAGSGNIVRTLVHAGANVDANGGVKHCTPLHMAARRDNVEIAEALVESGADIEARDSLGETPLRRSVNCGQTAVASLLLSKGADMHSKGSKGLTPVSAARTDAMRRLMQSCGKLPER